MSFRTFLENTRGDQWGPNLAIMLQWIRRGKLNNIEEVTLTAGTETTLTDQLIGPDSLVSLTAKDSAAAAITGIYVDTYDYGSCVIHHSAAAGSEVFRFSVTG